MWACFHASTLPASVNLIKKGAVMNTSKEQTVSSKTPTQAVALFLMDFVEVFVYSILFVLLLFSFFFRISVVDGDSMRNTLYDGELLVLSEACYQPKQEDIVVFHQGTLNKALVKRVIATEGQTVTIDFDAATVSVDGKVMNDSDFVFLGYPTAGGYYETGEYNRSGTLTVTVPEGQLFVMGDNRNNSLDSRYFGCIRQEQVFGKAIFRLKALGDHKMGAL